MNIKYKWLEELLDKVDRSIKYKTIFDIAGKSSSEVVLSNFYAYYFDENNDHGLSRVFLDTLISLYNQKSSKEFLFDGDYSVETEYDVDGKRIDILLGNKDESDNFRKVIIIENKIYHTINNDLKHYSDYFSNEFQIEKENKAKILLVLDKGSNRDVQKDGFYFITHKEFLETILSKHSEKILDIGTKEHFIFKDFKDNILNLSNKNFLEDDKNYALLVKYNDKIKELKKIEKKNVDYLKKVINNAFENTPVNIGEAKYKDLLRFEEISLFDSKDLYFHFNLSKMINTSTPSFSGYFQILGKNSKKGNQLIDTINISDNNEINISIGEVRANVGNYFQILKFEYYFNETETKELSRSFKEKIHKAFFELEVDQVRFNPIIQNIIEDYSKIR